MLHLHYQHQSDIPNHAYKLSNKEETMCSDEADFNETQISAKLEEFCKKEIQYTDLKARLVRL